MKKAYLFLLIALSLAFFAGSRIWLETGDQAETRPADYQAGEDTPPNPVSSDGNAISTTNESATSDNSDSPVTTTQFQSLPDELKNLRLIGIASNSESRPYAVIDNTRTNIQGLYKEGDEVEDANLLQILTDSVILSYKSNNYRIVLEKADSEETQIAAGELMHRTPNPFVYTTPEDIERAWDETQALMILIEMEQNLENGEPKGVRIESVTPDSVFEKVGFKPGDILTMVDDMDMNIADDAMEVYNCIRTKPRVTFTVMRQGKPNPVILEYDSSMLND